MQIEDIKYLLAKKGVSFIDIDKKHKLRYGSTRHGVSIPSEKAEKALSTELGIPVQKLFPDRYSLEGKRLRPQPLKNYTYQKRVQLNLKNGVKLDSQISNFKKSPTLVNAEKYEDFNHE